MNVTAWFDPSLPLRIIRVFIRFRLVGFCWICVLFDGFAEFGYDVGYRVYLSRYFFPLSIVVLLSLNYTYRPRLIRGLKQD